MVYIEVIFFNNLSIDIFLVFNSLVLRKRKMSKIRIAFSSIIGAIFAILYLFVPIYAQIIIKILLAPFMSIIFDKYKDIKDYLFSTLTFISLTYLLGGIVFGIQNLIGIEITKYLLLAAIIVSLFLCEIIVLKLAKTASKRHKIIKNAKVFIDGKMCEFRALYDSGNALIDTLTGLPVAVLSKSGINKFSALDIGKNDNIEGFITANTLSGTTEIPLIFVDKIVVENIEYNCLIALSDKDFDDCEMILNNLMTGESKNENKRNFSKDFKTVKN